jgi:periplasmic protein TonB
MNTLNVIHADLNDIIFDDRNKAYGAYHIRNEYAKTVWQAFGLATAAFVGLTLLMFFMQKAAPKAIEEVSEMISVKPVDLPPKLPEVDKKTPVVPDEPKEPSKPAAQPKGMDTQKFEVVKPSATANASATMAADSSFKNKQPGLTTTDSTGNNTLGGDPNGTGTDPVKPTGPSGTGNGNGNGTDIPDPLDVHLGTMPMPTNLDEIRKSIGYPAAARDLQLEGRVDFRVLVDEHGHYLRHMTLKRSHPIFEEACLKQLKNIQFEPGKMGDKPVKVWVMIPFKFTLSR